MPKRNGLSTKVDDLQNKDNDFMGCYDVGHAWSKGGYFHWNNSNGLCRKWMCVRCGTVREDYFTRKTSGSPWEKMDYRYNYAEGYLKNGSGRVAKRDIHNEVIRRVIQNDEFLSDEMWDVSPAELALL